MNTKSKLMITAIEEKNLDELKRLLKNGMKLNWMFFPQTALPLVLAAESGDIEFCRAIVKLGASLCACKGLPSPLSNAVYLNSITAVKTLIELGCDVNGISIQNGWYRKTPYRVQEWLRRSRKRIDFLRCSTSLSVAVLVCNYDILTALLEAGADMNKSDNEFEYGATPIHLLCESRSSSCNIKRIVEYFRLRPYLCLKPDLNCQDKFGVTPLMTACMKGNAEAVNFLLEQKVDLNIEDLSNRTALHCAVIRASESEDRHDSEKIATCLLRAGCVVDVPHWKDTLLNVIPSVNDKICEILVKCGVEIPLRSNAWGHNILNIAADAGNVVLMNMALMAGISVDTIAVQTSALMSARNCLIATKYLIQQQRARLDLEDTWSDNALRRCISCGAPGVCAYLIIEGSPRSLHSYRLAETKPRILELLLLTETSPLQDLISKYSADWPNYSALSSLESWTETTFYQLSQAMASNVHSLKHLCRLVIRDALVKHCNGRGILLSIDCLPLPSILKKYICYHEELNRLRLSAIFNSEDDDDEDIYDDDARSIHPNDLRYHRHRQRERPFDQIDDVFRDTIRSIEC